MATQITVTLLPTGNPNEFTLEFPSQVETRQTHIQRDTTAEIQAALVEGEFGYDAEAETLTGRFNNQFKSIQMAETALKSTVVEIGPWNMDNTASVGITTGIDQSKHRGHSVLIIGDDLVSYNFAMSDEIGALGGQSVVAADGNMTLNRTDGGWFDRSAFDDAVQNRGFVIIWHA